jgi:hypothetical protein
LAISPGKLIIKFDNNFADQNSALATWQSLIDKSISYREMNELSAERTIQDVEG